ncbi:hypothetical protein Dimus_031932 [Dionaea muscipula]
MVFEEFGVPLVNKKGEEPKRYDYFEETFLTMCKLKREDGIWWIGSGEDRRRDDDDVPEEEETQEEEGNQADFDWEAVVDEAAVEGNPGRRDGKRIFGVDPSCPIGRIRKSVMLEFQVEFERTRAKQTSKLIWRRPKLKTPDF